MGPDITDIGVRLQQARRTRGLTLHDISGTTKIPVQALQAIERGDFGRLPGGIFRIGYVRAFAVAVGLNADELAQAIRAHFEPPTLVDAVDEDAGPRHLRQLAIALVITVAVLACGLLLLQRRENPEESKEEAQVLIDETSRADTVPRGHRLSSMTPLNSAPTRLARLEASVRNAYRGPTSPMGALSSLNTE